MSTQPSPTHRISPEHTALGHAVRITRAIRRLSQEEVAFRGGLHRNYVGAIERGEINPSFRILLKLERGLDAPLSELIERTEDVLQGKALRSVVPRSRRWA